MKKRIISLLMVALLAACMVPLMAAPAFAASSPEGIVFGYAYDGQRSPSFPVAGETVTYSSITEPISTNGSDHDSTSDGSWCLTNVGTYGYVKSIGKGSTNLESIVNTVVDKYKDAGKTLDKNNIVIHELKNGSTHYAYGLTVAYDPTQDIVLFIGDNRGGGIGYILSKNEITVKSVTAVASLAIGDWTPPPTYGIAVNTAENGTVTSPVAAALAGDTIKLTVSPAAGYELSSLTVTAADNSSVSVSGDNSFTMPAQAVTVSAGFSPKSYTVTYKADGVPVGEPVTVEHGKDVPAEKIPAIPAKTGYDKTAPTRDDDGKNITTDTTINAVYTINKYSVTYKADGVTQGEVVTVEHGQDVPAEKIPAIPAKTGYDQTDPTWDDDGKNITADTTINALYTINTYEVKYMADGVQVGETQRVNHGGNATAPEVPAKEGYMGKWGSEGKNITGNTTIEAVYTLIPVEPPPEIPSTGDNSHVLLWGAVLVLTMTAAALIIGKKKYNT